MLYTFAISVGETVKLKAKWSPSNLCVSLVNDTFQETHKTYGSNPVRYFSFLVKQREVGPPGFELEDSFA